MGQVPAGDDHCVSAQRFGGVADTLPQAVMGGEGEAGQADPHQLIFRIILIYKPERHAGTVVQLLLTLSQGPGMEAP